MSKFNRITRRFTGVSAVRSEGRARTYEGAQGWLREPKGELFLLAVTNMVGEDTFYEAAGDRDARFRTLVRRLAVEDPDWVGRLVTWLRQDANLRSASLVAAAEAVKGRLDAGEVGHNRQVVAGALQRADEPGELLAYWTSRYGRAMPKPVKRGVADAVGRLYTERAVAEVRHRRRRRTASATYSSSPTRPRPSRGRATCSPYAIEPPARPRRGRADAADAGEPGALLALPVGERRAVLSRADSAAVLAEAGMTWESLAGLAAGAAGRAGVGGRHPVHGIHGAAAEPAQLRRGRRAGRRRRIGGGAAGRPGGGGAFASAADAVPLGVPGGSVAAVGVGAGAGAVGTRSRACRRCRVARWSWWTGRARCSGRCRVVPSSTGPTRRRCSGWRSRSAPSRPMWCSSVRLLARYVCRVAGRCSRRCARFSDLGGTNTAAPSGSTTGATTGWSSSPTSRPGPARVVRTRRGGSRSGAGLYLEPRGVPGRARTVRGGQPAHVRWPLGRGVRRDPPARGRSQRSVAVLTCLGRGTGAGAQVKYVHPRRPSAFTGKLADLHQNQVGTEGEHLGVAELSSSWVSRTS